MHVVNVYGTHSHDRSCSRHCCQGSWPSGKQATRTRLLEGMCKVQRGHRSSLESADCGLSYRQEEREAAAGQNIPGEPSRSKDTAA